MRRWVFLLPALATSCATVRLPSETGVFNNAYHVAGDAGQRASLGYIFRRAWVQLTANREPPATPAVVELDVAKMETCSFAVAWLGHSTLLIRAGLRWLLIDPSLFEWVGPLRGFGPKRLVRLPLAREALPRIDAVLISHDHYDHLDAPTLRFIADQRGGPPRFFAGAGLSGWFARQGLPPPTTMNWWDAAQLGEEVAITFVPAQHSSGRGLWERNRTLWGGWVVEYDGRRLYHAGDTAYANELFAELRARFGGFELAALPVGPFRPHEWMRGEHINPAAAVRVHHEIGAARSLAIHWGTFRLGDEDSAETVRAVEKARDAADGLGPTIVSIGSVQEISRDARKRVRSIPDF